MFPFNLRDSFSSLSLSVVKKCVSYIHSLSQGMTGLVASLTEGFSVKINELLGRVCFVYITFVSDGVFSFFWLQTRVENMNVELG